MATDITPSVGQGAMWLQAGPGASPGYGAVDRRRTLQAAGLSEGLLSENSYKVSQRAAGANMSVDIAASTGLGFAIQGDSITAQGVYVVGPHSAVINETIAAADATNPRNDLVVLEVKDDTHDAGALNKARTRVITGTPNASAAKTDALGANGTPALPDSAVPLAVVNVPAADTTISDSQIDGRRPRASGHLSIATEETRSNTAYGLMATEDRIRNVVLPTGGLIAVVFYGLFKRAAGAGGGAAALFLNSTQVKASNVHTVDGQEALTDDTSDTYGPLFSWGGGLASSAVASGAASAVTTGQVVGGIPDNRNINTAQELAYAGGPCYIFAAAGTYDVSVQFKAASGGVTAKERKFWVWTLPFPT